MDFGEKLLQLRKSKGMSQEALAEQLNTSRQAISKWENGQGYPETEKLLLISNLFNVSLDYLLKERVEPMTDAEKGYYVSLETAEGFLIFERKGAKYYAIGFSFLALACFVYFILQPTITLILIPVLAAIGLGIIVAAGMMEDHYEPLRREALIFDERVLKELKQRYANIRRKYISMGVIGVGCIFAGVTPLLLFEKGLIVIKGDMNLYYAASTLFIGIGIFIFIRVVTIMDAYEVLIKNEEHMNKLSIKLGRRFREKINRL